jgi:hypothetical protein
MHQLRALRRWLDEAFRVPGTSIRFGWDPIIGLVPWVGDLVTAFLSLAIITQAHRMRLPRVVQLRMLLNVVIDVGVGAVPVVGDVADVFWKSNSRNMALLERHSDEVRPASWGDWLFVSAIVTAVIAVARVPLFVMYWIVHALAANFPAVAR